MMIGLKRTDRRERALRSWFVRRRIAAIAEVRALGADGRYLWPLVVRLLGDRNGGVRTAAREALRSFGIEALDVLVDGYTKLLALRPTICEIVRDIGEAVLPRAAELRADADPALRAAGTAFLGAFVREPVNVRLAQELLHTLLQELGRRDEGYMTESPPPVIREARAALIACGPVIVPLLERKFHHRNELVPFELVAICSGLGRRGAEAILRTCAAHPDKLLRNNARFALQRMGDEAVKLLVEQLSGGSSTLRRLAMEALDSRANRDKLPAIAGQLVKLLADADSDVVEYAAWMLLSLRYRAEGYDEWILLDRRASDHWPSVKKAMMGKNRYRKSCRERPEIAAGIASQVAERSEELAPPLLSALGSEDPAVYEASLWALTMLSSDLSEELRAGVERALILLGMSADGPDKSIISEAVDRFGGELQCLCRAA